MKNTQWARLLAYVTGIVNQGLLLQNEYLLAENRILRAHLPARIKLTNDQRSTLAEIGKRIGRKALQQIACAAKPDTILAWYRRLIARKFDGSKFREYPGRPSVSREVAELVVQMARETRTGVTIALRSRWEILVTTYPIRPSATFCGGLGFHQLRSAVRIQHGPISFKRTWRFW